MKINPSLHFNGCCRAAFEKYQRVFGGTLQTMLSYGDSPMAAQVDRAFHHHIMHATLLLGDNELSGADMQPAHYRKPQGFSITLSLEGVERARGIFDALAQGGEIGFPFQTTFWSPGYGMVVDEFGIPWELNAS